MPAQRRLRAILYCEPTTPDASTEAVEMLRRAVEHHRGAVSSSRGSFVAVFDSASDAVYCAMSFQSWLEGRAALRVGIHIGDVEVADREISSEALAVARNIARSAEPGTIRVSQSVYDMVKARPEIHVAHLGEDGFELLARPAAVGRAVAWRSRARISIPILLCVLAAVGWFFWRWRRQAPARGRYIIALLPFSSTQDSSKANFMWNAVKDKLDKVVGRDPDVLVRAYLSHERPKSEEEAKAIGARLEANMVIWAQVTTFRRETRVQPYITMLNGPVNKGEPGALHASLDEPDEIKLHEQEADEVGNLVLLAVAKYYRSKQDYAKALSILKQIDPPESSSWIENALVLNSMGRWEEMRDALAQIKKPSPYVLRLKAWNRFLLGDTRGAIAELEQIQKADPKNAKTYQMLDYFYLDLGGEQNLQKALALNQKAEGLDPKNAVILADRAAISYQQGRFKDAARGFDRFAEESPAYIFARFLSYTSLRRAGQIEEAQAYLRKSMRHFPSVEIDPSEPWDRIQADYLAGTLGDREVLQAIRNIDPLEQRMRESSAYFFLGRDAEEKGDKSLARIYFQKSRAAGRRNFYEYSLSAFELNQLGKP